MFALLNAEYPQLSQDCAYQDTDILVTVAEELALNTCPTLPVDVINIIVTYIPNTSLHVFAMTCRACYNIVTTEHKHRVRTVLDPFCPDINTFLAMLRSADAIVSGSAALAAFFPTTFKPADLDIYVPERKADIVAHYLVHLLGYQQEASSLWHDYPYARPLIAGVVLFRKGDVFVHAVLVNGPNAVLPLFKFHSTIVMNFVSSDGLYCAYPQLTLDGKGLVNLEGSLPADKAACIAKYMQRGFEIERGFSNWPLLAAHECGSAHFCPRTLRSTDDMGSLFWSFSSLEGKGAVSSARHKQAISAHWLLLCRSACENIDDERGVTGLRNLIVVFWIGYTSVVRLLRKLVLLICGLAL